MRKTSKKANSKGPHPYRNLGRQDVASSAPRWEEQPRNQLNPSGNEMQQWMNPRLLFSLSTCFCVQTLRLYFSFNPDELCLPARTTKKRKVWTWRVRDNRDGFHCISYHGEVQTRIKMKKEQQKKAVRDDKDYPARAILGKGKGEGTGREDTKLKGAGKKTQT